MLVVSAMTNTPKAVGYATSHEQTLSCAALAADDFMRLIRESCSNAVTPQAKPAAGCRGPAAPIIVESIITR
ncbi:hypothetical protein M8494_27705 [Serratia ureilytica]